MTICLLCILRALATGEKPQPFDEHPFDHMKAHHPDPQAAADEQDALTDTVMGMAMRGELPGLDADAFGLPKTPVKES